MNKRTKTTVAAFAAGMCMSLAACGIGPDVYRYGDWPGDPAQDIDMLNEDMISICELTPADIVMIDLSSQRFRKAFYWDTCEQIKAGLPGYRETYGIELGSLVSNPSTDASLPSTEGLQYALLSVAVPGSHQSTEIFVDFREDTVSFGEDIIVNMSRATVVSLSTEQRQAVLTGLSPLTSWAMPWTQTVQLSDDIGGFWVMVIAEDGVLYRWTGVSPTINPDRTVPPGFMTVYDTFMALIP